MAQAGRRGFWQSLRDLPERTPLRVKLIAAVLTLATIALLVISVAGIQILKSDLLGPYDDQLQGPLAHEAGNAVASYLQNGQTYQGVSFAVDWIPANGSVHAIVMPVSQSLPRGTFPNPPGGLTARAMSGPVVRASQDWIAAHMNKTFTVPSRDGTRQWRVLVESFPASNGSPSTILVAVDVSSVYTTLGKLATVDLLVSIGIIGLLAVLGVALVRRSLRPLTEIEKTAGAIAAGDLSRRVPERDPRTEMGRLGRSLNVMLSQIESAFRSRSRSEAAARRSEERMRQFVADASHELRTPLTAIRGFAEYYRQRGGVSVSDAAQAGGEIVTEATPADAAANGGRSKAARQLAPADLDRIMRRVEQESTRMGILVEDMLLLARLDQQRPLTELPVDLLTLAADAVHDARVVAPTRSINLTVSSGRALLVIGDEVRLRQVIGNLMSNALTHTPEATPIDVLIRSGNLAEAAVATAMALPGTAGELDSDDEPAADNMPAPNNAGAAPGHVRFGAEHVPPPPDSPAPGLPTGRVPAGPAAVLEVTDHGPGLTREQAGHVFERFYRGDPARTKGGTGLGLAIVAALVAAHGGTCWVRSRPGEGATFCIALPLSPEAMQAAENDFDGDADDITAESGPAEIGTYETGTAENDGSETHTAQPGTAHTASARAELGG